MHVLHIRGGDKASWARLNRDQDIKSIGNTVEAEEFEQELFEL
jgi:hypothetical protein